MIIVSYSSIPKINPVWKNPACPNEVNIWKNKYIQKLFENVWNIAETIVTAKQDITTCFLPYLSAKIPVPIAAIMIPTKVEDCT